MIYALDTNMIIHLLNHDGAVVSKRNEAVLAGARFIIPPIVDYEIKRGLLYKPAPKKEKMYFVFRKHYGVGNMTSEMWTRAAHIYVELRRNSLTVGDDDIFIAAFCIISGYTLVTRNTRDFEDIKGLRLVNWIDAGR